MKIKKVPDQILITVEGVRFTFEKPCALDFLEMDDPSLKARFKAIAKRIKKIEGATFEDGGAITAEAFVDFPLSVIVQVVKLYSDELAKIYDFEAAEKKSEAPT